MDEEPEIPEIEGQVAEAKVSETESEPTDAVSVNFEQVAEYAIMTFIGSQFLQGELHLRKRRWKKAARAYQRVIFVTGVQREITSFSLLEAFEVPDTALRTWAFYKLGLALEQVPDLPKATEAMRRALAADPGLIEARMALARVAVERSDFGQAIAEYENAYAFVEGSLDQRSLDKDSKAAIDRQRCDILTRLGCLLMDLDRHTEAQAVLARAIAVYPDSSYALANYAVAAGRRGDTVQLRKYLGMALERTRSAVDDVLIMGLIQDASNAEYGDVVLQMLLAYQLIKLSDFTRYTTAREGLRRGPGSIHIDNSGEMVMNPGNGSIFTNFRNSVGTQGDHSTNHGTVIGQQVNQVPSALSADLTALIAELGQLERALRELAANSGQYQVLTAIVAAREAAEIPDRPAVAGHLRAAGQWALEVASNIGTSVVETAIRAVLPH